MAYSERIAAEVKAMLERIKEMQMEESGTDFYYVFVGATINHSETEEDDEDTSMDVIYSISVDHEEELDELLGFASHAFQVDERHRDEEERFEGKDTTDISFWLNYGIDGEN